MINNVVISDSITNVLLVPAGKTYAGVGMYFCNTSNESDTLTVYVVPDGALPSDTNTVLKDISISAKDTFEFGAEKFLLEQGDKIAAKSAAGSRISATVTYTEI